jgi:hypothetical protein
MKRFGRIVFAFSVFTLSSTLVPANAQPLGAFSWQLQPFCNRVTLNVTQNGGIYTLDGVDDQCGAAKRAVLVGLATPNADGTIGFGFHLVVPGGQPVHVDAQITFPALNGTWRDSAGNAGAFAFNANAGGTPRPLPVAATGDITAVTAGTGLSGGGTSGEVTLAINGSVVQNRVSGTCGAGQAVRTINQDGTVACEPVAGGTGDITGVTAGAGLTGGGTSGEVTLAINGAVVQNRVSGACGAGQAVRTVNQDGSVACEPIPAASLGDITGVAAGAGLTGGGAAGDISLAVNPAVVQNRVTGTCAAGEAVRTINPDGTVACEPVGSGDITAVNTAAGSGLTGGVTNGAASLTVVFGGDGALNAAARADHEHATANGSIAVGSGALAVSTSASNVAVGTSALGANTSGSANTAVGRFALNDVTTGSTNTAVGAEALRANTTNSNTAVGASALRFNTTGSLNVGVGLSALFANETGGNNVAVGVGALDANVSGSNNTGVGSNALSVSTGTANVALGDSAGAGNTAGTFNTFLGTSASAGAGTLSNATAIGARARVDQDDSLILGSIGGVNGATASTRVGIGTTTPATVLEIVDAPPASVNATVVLTSLDTNDSRLMLRHANGTAAALTGLQLGNDLGRIDFAGHDGAIFTTSGQATILSRATEPWNGTARGSRLIFGTTANATANVVLNRMIIDHDGQVSIGPIGDPLDQLQVVGDIRVGTSGSNGCLKNFGGGLIIGSCSSDIRLKRDVTPFPLSLDRVAALRPVQHFWRAEAFPARGFGTEQAYGLIAQEVEQVLPELVTTDDEGYKRVDYSKLPLLAIQAIKELKERNDALTTSHAALEQRLEAIEALLASRQEN